MKSAKICFFLFYSIMDRIGEWLQLQKLKDTINLPK